MRPVILLISIGMLALHACSSSEDKVVARVYDAKLTLSDLKWMQADFSSDSENLRIDPVMVEAWVRKQAMVHAAENALKADEKRFERELRDYYETLLVDAYENKAVEARINRKVSEEEIQAYYQTHKADFEMHKTIVRINYAKFPADFSELETAGKLLQKGRARTAAEQAKLEKLCFEHAENMYLDFNWVVFDDILKEIPLDNHRPDALAEKNEVVMLNDSASVYLVRFLEAKVNETYSPLDIERERIRELLLDKRRVEARERLRRETVEKARKEHEINYEINF
ncbi:MAG: hypothetical protein J5873_05715 [Bacteroidales bacterium]|nr:hypothetical protein [Bacteroidales bacterium]